MGLSSKEVINNDLLAIMKKKAMHSPSAFMVSAAAFSKRGNLLGIKSNGFKDTKPTRRGAGKHAEHELIKQFGKRIDTIYIIRYGRTGDRLPINACENCSKMANKLGIKIISFTDNFGYKPTEVYP